MLASEDKKKALTSPSSVFKHPADVVACGDLRLRTPWLTVPHPRVAERAFALAPLADTGVTEMDSSCRFLGVPVSVSAAIKAQTAVVRIMDPSTATGALSQY